MKTKVLFATLLLLIGAQTSMATEEASYVVLKSEGKFEVREYSPHVLAETLVEGDFENAASKAFQKLFRYISGDNVSHAKVAMTAPVSQVPASETIQMTAPVGQQRAQEHWAVSFMMPKSYTLSSLPKPKDPGVFLRQVPAQKMAVVRYSGTWSEKNYSHSKLELASWMRKAGLIKSGPEIWARYNPPFTPWFLRRNEILIPIN